MTWLAVLALGFTGTFAALVTYGLITEYRTNRYWRRHNERMAAYHERIAAQNGRPHTDAVELVTRREP